MQQKEQTARKELENSRARAKRSKETREFENKKHAFHPKPTGKFQNKEQTARKRLEKLKTRSKPLEGG